MGQIVRHFAIATCLSHGCTICLLKVTGSRVFFAVFFLSLIEPTHRIHAPDEQSNTVLQIVWEGSDHYKRVKIKSNVAGVSHVFLTALGLVVRLEERATLRFILTHF